MRFSSLPFRFSFLRFRFASWWFRADKEALVFLAILGLLVAVFGFTLSGVAAYKEERRNQALAAEKQTLTCLARNVYFEARGEPLDGQYAVAEVTMNRKASPRYPDTVCEVVHQKNWDPIRGRYVGAFSWTEFSELEEPRGEAWQRAWKIAEAVYYGREAPKLEGALFFHATYIRPGWAKGKQTVARIGRHVFYR
jgi:N-acetylmuramoyl-L-alanine amidase